jgi:hypothetical protein
MLKCAPRTSALQELSEWPFSPSSTVKNLSRTLVTVVGYYHLPRSGFIWLSVRCIRLACFNEILELAGFLIPATQILGFAAATIETAVGLILELLHTRAAAPLHEGKSGWTVRISGSREGPVALIIRILWHAEANGRRAAAICFPIGALCSRYAWIWAGRASAHDPQALFQEQQRKS